jgi:hypothetical protein
VRLCLDEHYSSKIAEDLRVRSHDMYAVSERVDLRALSDGELWLHLQAERRALLTENVGDFMPFLHEASAAGEAHWGLILSSPKSMPRGAGTIGLLVERLDEVLAAHRGEQDFQNGMWWL